MVKCGVEVIKSTFIELTRSSKPNVIERDNVAEPSNELGFIGRLKNDLLFCVLVRLLFVQSKTEEQTEVSCAACADQ